MKKGMKIAVGILLVIAMGIGGFFYMQHKEHEKMVAIATSEEAKKVYEDMIYKLDKNAFKQEGVIKNYKIEKETLAYNPMGGLMVSIIVNDDENLYINYNLIDNGDGTYHSAFYSYSGNLQKLLEK
jgi:hypothetical protein